jgi:hypothetical protein
MRRLAKLTAGAIDVAVTVVTAPATWVASGLRRYADKPDDPPAAD